jgi:hypothetical protein
MPERWRIYIRKSAGIKTLVFLFIFLVFLRGKSYSERDQPWIKATTQGFVKEGRPFRFIGASAVNLVFYDDWDLSVEKAVKTAKENNISVLRLYIDLGWGKAEDFDNIFDIAAKNGVYIILVFTDCCCSCDYPDLKRYFEVHAPFCNITNAKSKNALKKLIRQIIERRNSVNGRIYRDDPTIMAWEIANELQYWLFSKSEVRAWIEEIASYIKSLDGNHPVTIGISANVPEDFNDFEDYLNNAFKAKSVDFFSFHFYPPAGIKNTALLKKNINRIKLITKEFLALGKPVVMGEFGFSNSSELSLRSRSNKETANFYNEVFKDSMDSAFRAGCSGAMFWGWGVPQEKTVPMWWRNESHNSEDEIFCRFLKQYRIPDKSVPQ